MPPFWKRKKKDRASDSIIVSSEPSAVVLQNADRKGQSVSSRPYPTDAFQYEPLADGEIRLLRLAPGKGSSPIQCDLLNADVFHEGWKYTALSYVWGPQNQRKTIDCRGGSLSISESLFVALQQLRSKDESQMLWIDQICINQSDGAEKTKQVQMMRDIYGQAQKIIVWLGSGTKESHTGMKLAKQLLTLRELNPSFTIQANDIGRAQGLPKASDKAWSYLQSIFHNAWFSRVWTIQEAVMSQGLDRRVAEVRTSTTHVSNGAQSLTGSSSFVIRRLNDRPNPSRDVSRDIQSRAAVVWGDDHMSFDDMTKLTWIVPDLIPRRFPAADVTEKGLAPHRLRAVHEHMTSRRQEKTPRLIDLLLQHRGCGATDKRDVIFAFLGLDRYSSYDIVPEYSSSNTAEKVYLDFAVDSIKRLFPRPTTLSEETAVLEARRLFSILYSAGRANQQLALPSWAPDWSIDFSAYPLWPVLDWEETGIPFTDGDYAAGTRQVAYFELKEDPEHPKLIVSGAVVDKIATIGQRMLNLKQQQPATARQNDMAAWLLEARSLAAAQYDMEDDYPNVCNDNDGMAQSSNNSQSQAFKWTLNVGKYHGHTVDYDVAEDIAALQKRKDIINTVFGSWAPDMLSRVLRYAHGRQFFTTEKGLMGLAPQGARAGDEIALLVGGDVPVVIRADGDEHILIGECYMHGIMQGELLFDWVLDTSDDYVAQVPVPRPFPFGPITFK